MYLSFIKNYKTENYKGSKTENFNVKWNLKTANNKTGFSQNDFLELCKALIESKAIEGTQRDIINALSKLFQIEIKNPDQSLQSIKLHRKKEKETKFLDLLKTSQLDWINKEKEK